MTLIRVRLAAALAATLGAGCIEQPVPPGPLQPACEARSTRDAARLNIDSRAEDFGLSPPCRATLNFSIAANTGLRALHGRILASAADGPALGAAPFTVALPGPESGMFRGEVAVTPGPETACREIALALEIQRCIGADGNSVTCPAVRIRASDVLLRLEAEGSGVSVCYDE